MDCPACSPIEDICSQIENYVMDAVKYRMDISGILASAMLSNPLIGDILII